MSNETYIVQWPTRLKDLWEAVKAIALLSEWVAGGGTCNADDIARIIRASNEAEDPQHNTVDFILPIEAVLLLSVVEQKPSENLAHIFVEVMKAQKWDVPTCVRVAQALAFTFPGPMITGNVRAVFGRCAGLVMEITSGQSCGDPVAATLTAKPVRALLAACVKARDAKSDQERQDILQQAEGSFALAAQGRKSLGGAKPRRVTPARPPSSLRGPSGTEKRRLAATA